MVTSTGARSVSLERVIELSRLTPGQAVAIAQELLRALEREGPTATAVTLEARDVRVTADGAVEIVNRDRPPAGSDDDAGVQAVGQLACQALEAGSATPADPLVEVALQALAMGALGRSPAGASEQLGSQLRALTSDAQLRQERDELAGLVQRIQRRGIAGPVPKQPAGRAGKSTRFGGLVAGLAMAAAVLALTLTML